MQGLAARALADLFAAGEAVGHDQGVARRLPYPRQKHALAALDRDVVVIAALEAEGARHAAAARIE